MNWFTSLPDKFCAQILAKVKEIASADGNQDYKKDYRVILRLDSPHGQRIANLKGSAKPHTAQVGKPMAAGGHPTGVNEIVFAITKLDAGQSSSEGLTH